MVELRMPESSGESAWKPLAYPIFRALWIATIASNVGSFMQDVGEAWLMTTLTPSPLLVALVQAAASLPAFLLALPSGALADIIDRRRLLLFTQTWMLAVAGVAGLMTISGLMTPRLLLSMAFLMGLGEALNGPAWLAITPEMVPSKEVKAAITLNGAGFNVSRAVGPALAGFLITLFNPGTAFVLNALSFVGVIYVLYRWRRAPDESTLPREQLHTAMRLGLRYVRHTPTLQSVFVRSSVFIACGSAVLALLPIFARQELRLGAFGYGLLLGAFGAGAIVGAAILPKLGRDISINRLTVGGTVLFAATTFGQTALPYFAAVCVALFIAGIAWLAILSNYMTVVQVACPSWVRGRVLAVYILVFSGSLVVGSAAWGEIASLLNASGALRIASIGLLVGLVTAAHYKLPEQYAFDFTPSGHWGRFDEDAVSRSEALSRTAVTIEYQIDPSEADQFLIAMEDVRNTRLRTGAENWNIYRDIDDPTRYVEIYESPTWIEHQRMHERVSIADQKVESKVRSYHAGDVPVQVSHFIAVSPPAVGEAKDLSQKPQRSRKSH